MNKSTDIYIVKNPAQKQIRADTNLRIIKVSENISKQQRCDKTLDELFENYIKYENLNKN